MKDRKCTVRGMVEQFGGRDYVTVTYPETMAELARAKAIKIVSDTGTTSEYEYSEEKKIVNSFRGFGLSFQTAGSGLTEEEKVVRKAERKAESAQEKVLRLARKSLGIDLATLITRLQAGDKEAIAAIQAAAKG